MIDYRKLCIELFGTDDVEELREIAEKKQAGRKKVITEKDKANMIKLLSEGKTTAEVAALYNVSRQTVSKYINTFPDDNYRLRIDFMFKQKVCTEIYVDFLHERIKIVNRTDDIMKRAFGTNENPDWKDFRDFLESRCMPRSRSFCKTILKRTGIDSYDELQIVEKNKGRTAEDNQYMNFVYRRSA